MNNPFAGLPNGDEVGSQFEAVRGIFYKFDFVKKSSLHWDIRIPFDAAIELHYLNEMNCWLANTDSKAPSHLEPKKRRIQNIADLYSKGMPDGYRKRAYNELAGHEIQFEKRLIIKLSDFLPEAVAVEAAECIARRECLMRPIIGTRHWAAAVMAQKLEGYFLLAEQVRMEVLNL